MIHFLNEAGRQALAVASAMLWQTAVLVLALLLVEFLVGRRMRASLRCGLWLLVILKLLLPPSLKSPVSPGYWIGRWIIPPLVLPAAPKTTPISGVTPRVPGSVSPPWTEVSPPGGKRTADRPASTGPRLHATGALAGLWALGMLAVSLGILRRHQQVRRLINTARQAPGELLEALRGAATELGLRRLPELRLTQADHSPAVSGLLHPVIVLPAGLATRLTSGALRDVLLHELVHIRRR
ncbi:MAG: M56 family metallopeptidase, partial [Verrucomicrobiales bacterium]|nr:M56 family metallopeptidase [Verrucomicrobiales bacterium]